MPLYEYRCAQCSQTFELLRGMENADRDVVCPKCASEEVERLLSTFSGRSGGGGCGAGGGGRFT